MNNVTVHSCDRMVWEGDRYFALQLEQRGGQPQKVTETKNCFPNELNLSLAPGKHTHTVFQTVSLFSYQVFLTAGSG